MKTLTSVIIAGIDEGRERYLLFAKSTPKKTWVQWTDSKDEAHDLKTVENARRLLKHMDLPIRTAVVVRHEVG